MKTVEKVLGRLAILVVVGMACFGTDTMAEVLRVVLFAACFVCIVTWAILDYLDK